MINAQTDQSMGCQCPACRKTLHASDCAVHNAPAYPAGECDCGAQPYPENFIDALKYDVARRDSEFITHSVDQPYDWSEWVCPDPKSYLMKCCDCGLVHEAEFGVVRYKSETEREDCDRVDDPNLQAVFRMRRSEQWSPSDMAHRAGGLMMEQPAQQEPLGYIATMALNDLQASIYGDVAVYGEDLEDTVAIYTTPQPPAQHEPEIVQRVRRYAGQTLRTARNPNITARECIELADCQHRWEPVEGQPLYKCVRCNAFMRIVK